MAPSEFSPNPASGGSAFSPGAVPTAQTTPKALSQATPQPMPSKTHSQVESLTGHRPRVRWHRLTDSGPGTRAAGSVRTHPNPPYPGTAAKPEVGEGVGDLDSSSSGRHARTRAASSRSAATDHCARPHAAHANPGSRAADARTVRSAKRATKWRWVGETVGVLAGAVVIAFLLRMFVVQVYQIPSGSMTETLQVGSRIAVNRLPGLGKQVERGDVVVFQDDLGWLPTLDANSRNPLTRVGEFLGVVPADGEQVLVKRVIGVGGDTVECCSTAGKLMVNGVEIDEPYAKGSPGMGFEVTVPEGSLWVMGDNRANSADSLYHYMQGDQAFVSQDSVIGRAMWEIWPIDQWSSLGDRDIFVGVGKE